MKPERLLQITLVLLLALGNWLRSPGLKDPLLPLLVLLFGAASIYLTDVKGRFHLSRRVANVLALLSVTVSMYNFTSLDSAAQLLAIAKLLAFLQIILLFREKTPRLYWQLFTLSVLQVVVGAALNVSIFFGMLLVLYMFLGLVSLIFFFLYREQERPSDAESPHPADRPEPPIGNGRARYPLALAPPVFSSGPDRYASPDGIRQTLRQAGAIVCGALVMTTLLFIAAPRSGKSDWNAVTDVGATPMTGFTPEVKLGDLGTIQQNSQPVMRVKLIDEAGAPLALVDQPLFRGSLMNYYEGGRWTYRPQRPGVRVSGRWQNLPKASDDRRYVRQEIVMEPLNEPVLFAIYSPIELEDNRYLEWNPTRMRLTRPKRRLDERFRYVLGTTGILQGRQWPLVPQINPYDGPEGGLPADVDQDLPGEVKAMADNVLADANVAPDDRLAQINALVKFLRDSGEFEYTLDGQRRNSSVDPVVDFLRTNRRGHCEFFATALCLMLRSQGIPARMAAGFYGDWNPLTQDYQVRQLHAHAWVEAYLTADQVPAELKVPELDIGPGGWLTLDPTPGVVTDPATRRGMFAPLANFFDYTQIMWYTYVVGMNQSFQYESIYSPVRQWIVRTTLYVQDTTIQASRAFWEWLSGDWFSGRGALTLGLLAALAWAGVRLARVIEQRRRRRAIAELLAPGRASDGAVVEFYRRLEELLAQQGLLRARGQTPREFAVSIAPHLALLGSAARTNGNAVQPMTRDADGPRTLGEIPRLIVEAFYRIRYGGRVLDKHERQTIEAALAQVEETISEKR